MTQAKYELPSISTYGNGGHALRVDIGALTVWFSYNTAIAFRLHGPIVVRENDWGPTTGKHLNAIDGGDKKSRVPSGRFEQLFNAALQEARVA